MKSQSWLWSLIAVLVLAGGSYGVFVLFGEEPLPQGIVYGNGHIEGREVRIAAEVAGRVIEHHLAEGSKVSAGDTVAVIDRRCQRPPALGTGRAGLGAGSP